MMTCFFTWNVIVDIPCVASLVTSLSEYLRVTPRSFEETGL